MTGFVDPSYRHLNAKQERFVVWRVSKKQEENYEVKVVKREHYGQFHNECAYIVFSVTPPRRPPGCVIKPVNPKMEVHIHLWLGSRLEENDRRIAVVKVMELDLFLDNIAVLHREVEGWESSRFLSYFKGGMSIRIGERTGAGGNEFKPTLFKLREMGSTPVLIEHPSISWFHLYENGVFVLETEARYFLWLGKSSRCNERFLALKFCHQVDKIEPKKPIVWVFDGKEDALEEEALNDFQQHLHLVLKSRVLSSDWENYSTKWRKFLKLYEVKMKNDTSDITFIKDGPLNRSDLNFANMYLIDHERNGLWIWVSKKMSEDFDKSRAINIAWEYQQKKTKPLEPVGTREDSITRVVEGREPEEFKLLFTDWRDPFAVTGRDYFGNKAMKPVNSKFTANLLEDNPFLAAETQLFDNGSGKMKIWMLKGADMVPQEAVNYGIFHSTASYLVQYTYNAHDKEINVIYHWVGSEAPKEDKDHTIWPSLQIIFELSNSDFQVRTVERKEPAHFLALFRGQMLVLNSGTSAEYINSKPKQKSILDCSGKLLLKVDGGDVFNTRSVEVEASATSLNTNNVFILRTPKESFVWCGLNTTGDEREIGKSVAEKWTSTYSVMVEGQRNDRFWQYLGGDAEVSQTEVVRKMPSVNVPARLYICSVLDDEFSVQEVPNFGQKDLSSGGLVILDAWTSIFVWTGMAVPAEEKPLCQQLAWKYLNSDPCCRDPDMPIIQVHQGREPSIFRGFFPSWHQHASNFNVAEETEIKICGEKRRFSEFLTLRRKKPETGESVIATH